jgi:hypothetical protein
MILLATGLGATSPAATTGGAGRSSAPFNEVAAPFDVFVGGNRATVSWAGLAPGFAGVYQINVVVPAGAVGDVLITCTTCADSNNLQMPRPPLNGPNTANVSGSVTILYPANQATVTFSPAFAVAKIAAQIDIKPDAGKFTLSAVARIGSAAVDGTTIQFDPASGLATLKIPSPTAHVRAADFSYLASVLTVVDFLCASKNCPMPGNVVNPSRLSPLWLTAMNSVIGPNTDSDAFHSFLVATQEVKAGSTFIIADHMTNGGVAAFASFDSISYPTGKLPISVTLYIDGQLVAAATATYKPPA